jgi:hypothetical protein
MMSDQFVQHTSWAWRKELARWLAKIPSERSRTLTEQKLDLLLAKAARAYG